MAQIREEIYYSLISCGLFPEKPKGCHKGTRRTGDLLHINPQGEQNETQKFCYGAIEDKKVYDLIP